MKTDGSLPDERKDAPTRCGPARIGQMRCIRHGQARGQRCERLDDRKPLGETRHAFLRVRHVRARRVACNVASGRVYALGLRYVNGPLSAALACDNINNPSVSVLDSVLSRGQAGYVSPS